MRNVPFAVLAAYRHERIRSEAATIERGRRAAARRHGRAAIDFQLFSTPLTHRVFPFAPPRPDDW